MRTLIPPAFYHSDSLFRREIEKLTTRVWQFGGLKRDLANDNDFITINGPGKPVVIQNFQGEMRAYQNICLHRHSLIRPSRQGNEALQCPYHGWTYDKEGRACGIPHRSHFSSLNQSEPPRLPRYQVETCGEYVFFADSRVTTPLTESLGEVGNLLQSFSPGIGSFLDRTHWDIQANWKVVLENTLEAYHIDKVHPGSLKKLFRADGEEFRIHLPHSASLIPLREATIINWKKLESQLPSRPTPLDGYVHIHLFPFTTVATTFGASFSIQRVIPISAARTRFESEVYFTNLESPSHRQELLADSYGKSIIEFNRSIFDEDKEICEVVQRGLDQADHTGWLGKMEVRVASFQRSYMDLVAEDL